MNSALLPPWPLRLGRYMWHHHAEMWRHVARRWYAYAAATLLGVAASHYIGLNFTDSVPERVVWLEHGVQPSRGDLIVFRFQASDGPSAKLSGTRWLKHVQGMPGDRIVVQGRVVHVNGMRIGELLERTPRGTELHPISDGVIPAGHYFIAGESADSLDSRYREIGLVRSDQVIARARRIF